jgi:hypothetical protein
MASETEELKLVVSVVDNASSGLEKIVEKAKELGGSGVREAQHKMAEGTKELHKIVQEITGGFGDATKALGLFRLGAMGAAGGILALSIAAKEGIGAVGEFANEMRKMQRAAEKIGVDPGQFKGLIEQFNAVGISTEEAMHDLETFSAKMADLGRQGSEVRREMLRMSADPGQMREFLRELSQAQDEATQLNLVREAGEAVYRNALAQTHNQQEAANRRNKFWADLGYSDKLAQLRQAQQLTEEEKQWNRERMANGETFANMLNKISGQFATIREFFLDPLIDPNGPLFRTMTWFKETLDHIIEKLAEIKREGADAIPGVKAGKEVLENLNPPTLKDNLAKPFSNLPLLPGGNRPLQENTEAQKKLKQSNDELIDMLKGMVSPMGFHGNGPGGGLLQNANFTTGGESYGRGRSSAPYGNDSGPGTGAGAGSRGTVPRSLSGGAGNGGGGGEADTSDPSKGGNEYLKSQRQRIQNELDADPELRRRFAAIIQLENAGAGTAVAESAMNRAAMTGRSLRSILSGGPRSFYGPARAGLVEPKMRSMSAKDFAARNAQINEALSGSDIIKMHTDQGSRGDPNYERGGVGVNVNRERFNDWGGFKGVENSRRWREEQEARVNRSTEEARRSIDKKQSTVGKVEGSGKISVDVNAPKGTTVGAEGGGIFKDVEINRQTQMEPARVGPETYSN